jgi:SAM-dependent methyltransferase
MTDDIELPLLPGQTMTRDIFFEIHQDLPREGPGRDRYTRQAYRMLPALEDPAILDIGCGPGSPTLELARLSGGNVIGLDVHQPYLDRLNRAVEEAGLSDRVTTINGSMFDMDFSDESFDIIWAEGSIFLIGFEKGIKAWRRFIKPRGFLVVHDVVWLRDNPPEEVYSYWKAAYPGIRTVPAYVDLISRCAYHLVGHFTLPEDAWWHTYYGPLEKKIEKLRKKYVGDPAILTMLDEEQLEIDMFRKHSQWYGSVFFVMQKEAP